MKTFTRPVLTLACASLLAAAPVFAKCTVTLKMSNGNGEKITVLGDDSQSRVNGGFWSKMKFHNTPIAAGASAETPWSPDMSCCGSAKRDLRFKYQSAPSNAVFEEVLNNIDVVDGVAVHVTLKH